jgi:hypothetical protein
VADQTQLGSTASGSVTVIALTYIVATGSTGVPAGAILPFAGTVIPSGWLECDGRSVDKTAYPDLFTAIGTTYGGDGAPNFRLPSLKTRVPMGRF